MFFNVPVRSSAWVWPAQSAAANARPNTCSRFIRRLLVWMIARDACINRDGIECDFWVQPSPMAGISGQGQSGFSVRFVGYGDKLDAAGAILHALMALDQIVIIDFSGPTCP